MKRTRSLLVLSFTLLCVWGSLQGGLFHFVSFALADETVRIEDRVGTEIDLQSFVFRNEENESVHLSQYFSKNQPVLLSFVYYECPSLCGIMLNALTEGMKGLRETAGKDFQVIQISISPKESASLAQKKKEAFLEELGRPEAAQGWHFLTGDGAAIGSLAEAMGFYFQYNEGEKEYLHASGLYVLNPQGKIIRILLGANYPAQTLNRALQEASSGVLFTPFFYRYDPQVRAYQLNWSYVLFGTLSVLASLAIVLFAFFYHSKVKKWKKELLWTMIPVLYLAFLCVWGFKTGSN